MKKQQMPPASSRGISTKGLRIPEIRDCLHVLADLEVAAGRTAQGALLHYLAEATRRRRAVHRAPIQRAPRPPRTLVEAYIRSHPGADYMAIANAFGTNVGRISEVLSPP